MRKTGWETGSERQAGIKSCGCRKECGFSSKYHGKLSKGFKAGVMGSDLSCKEVTLLCGRREE